MENFTSGYTANRLSDITLYRPQARKSLWMLSKSLLIGLWISLGWLGAIQAQTNLGGIINTYAPVTAISGNAVTIGSSVGATHTFAVGDMVVIVQMTGSTNANAGHYDMRKITAVSGSIITVNGTSLAGRYDSSSESVQLVYAPYDTTGFTVTSVVRPLAWNGTVGGIIVAVTKGTIVMNANIDASCSGFNSGSGGKLLTGSNIYYGGGGGPRANGASGGSFGLPGFGPNFSGANNVVPLANYNGGDYNYPNNGVIDTVYPAGGGGGGSGGGGGGGGGGYYAGGGGGGASPTQAGCGGIANSSVGGVGTINGSGGSLPENLGGYGGTKYAGGQGGNHGPMAGGYNTPYPLSTSNYENFLNTINPRVQMGGSGTPSTTPAGGGIVILKANSINGNSMSILTNGCTGGFRAGGSGAGTIIVDAKTFTSATSLSAAGGKGSAGTVHGQGYADAGGGGGGGGTIWVSNNASANNLNNTLNPPSIANVSFISSGGAGGPNSVYPKEGGFTAGGGCGGAGIVYASHFFLVCEAGIISPILSAIKISSVCPDTTANLNSLVTSSCPTGSILDWHTTNTNLSAANQVSNLATASGTYYAACFDQTNGCYSPVTAGVTATITICTDLTIVKSGPTTVTTNGILSYTLLITNNGPIAADNSTVTDANIANFTANSVVCSAISGGASCPTLANLTIANLQAGTVVIPTLPNGGSVSLKVIGTAQASGTITNTALVTPAVGIGGDSTPANNTSTATTTIAKTCAAIPTPLVK